MDTPLKTCPCCSTAYPLTSVYFHRDKTSPMGFYPYCKPCRKEKARKHFLQNTERIRERNQDWRNANREYANAKAREWSKNNRERHNANTVAWKKRNPTKNAQWARQWRANNQEAYTATDRAYRHANREHIRDRNRQLRLKYPERFKAYRANGEAKRRIREQNGVGVIARDIVAQLTTQQGRCYWCSVDTQSGYHVDHRIPLSRGGEHSPHNIVITCPTCNLTKSDKIPYEEWIPPNPLS